MIRQADQCPSGGNVNNATAPKASIAAIAYPTSVLRALIAPFDAMIADTPQIDVPMASSEPSLPERPNQSRREKDDPPGDSHVQQDLHQAQRRRV